MRSLNKIKLAENLESRTGQYHSQAKCKLLEIIIRKQMDEESYVVGNIRIEEGAVSRTFWTLVIVRSNLRDQRWTGGLGI